LTAALGRIPSAVTVFRGPTMIAETLRAIALREDKRCSYA
jgi:hypothetical protein